MTSQIVNIPIAPRTTHSYQRAGWTLVFKTSDRSRLRVHTDMPTKHVYVRVNDLTEGQAENLARDALATALTIHRAYASMFAD